MTYIYSNMGKKHNDLLSASRDKKYIHIRDRILAVKMVLVQKHTRAKTAEFFKVADRTIYNWIERYERDGITGLEDQPGRGRKKDVPDKIFKKILESGVTETMEIKKTSISKDWC